MCVQLCGRGSCICVCFSMKVGGGGQSTQDAFASASRVKVCAARFTVKEPDTIGVISVTDTVSHTSKRGRQTAEALKGMTAPPVIYGLISTKHIQTLN